MELDAWILYLAFIESESTVHDALDVYIPWGSVIETTIGDPIAGCTEVQAVRRAGWHGESLN
jgi:hypothetical protein